MKIPRFIDGQHISVPEADPAFPLKVQILKLEHQLVVSRRASEAHRKRAQRLEKLKNRPKPETTDRRYNVSLLGLESNVLLWLSKMTTKQVRLEDVVCAIIKDTYAEETQ